MASGTVIFYCSHEDVDDDGDNNEHNVITDTGNLRYTWSLPANCTDSMSPVQGSGTCEYLVDLSRELAPSISGDKW